MDEMISRAGLSLTDKVIKRETVSSTTSFKFARAAIAVKSCGASTLTAKTDIEAASPVTSIVPRAGNLGCGLVSVAPFSSPLGALAGKLPGAPSSAAALGASGLAGFSPGVVGVAVVVGGVVASGGEVGPTLPVEGGVALGGTSGRGSTVGEAGSGVSGEVGAGLTGATGVGTTAGTGAGVWARAVRVEDEQSKSAI